LNSDLQIIEGYADYLLNQNGLTRLNLVKHLRIKISDKTQLFDVAMTSFSSEKIKFKLT